MEREKNRLKKVSSVKGHVETSVMKSNSVHHCIHTHTHY